MISVLNFNEVLHVPVYEYQCDCCGSHFDIRQSFNDAPVAFCPKCKAKARRVFQAPPIIFKGGGFYVTENRHDDGDGEKPHKSTAKPAEKPAEKPVDSSEKSK